jgi:hypothetical protein
MNAFIHPDFTQKFGRFFVQATGNVVASAVTAFLILAWLLTQPFFELSDHVIHGRKMKQPIKGKL